MKVGVVRIILFFCLLLSGVEVWGNDQPRPSPDKQTYVYAVDGVDTLRLDHYVAPEKGCRPCVIFVFGGGFSGGVRDKQADLPYFEFLLGEGFDVVSIDYRLGMKNYNSSSIFDFFGAMENSVNMAVEDLFRATNFILEHATQWQIDTHNIVASGSSAGAITVLQGEYMICNKMPLADILPEEFNYAGVMSFAGAVYTLDGAPDWTSAAAPMLLFHGNADRQVPYNKVAMFGCGMYGSKYIAKRLKECDAPYWFYSVEYETHAMASKPMHENHAEMVTFLEEFVLKRRPLQRTSYITDGAIPECRTFFLPTDYINSNY